MSISSIEISVSTQNKSLYIPERGVLVELPPSCSEGISICPETGRASIDPLVRTQLRTIQNDPIIRGRYPSTQEGEQFMDEVSPQWRDRLLEHTEFLSEEIKQACFSIGSQRFAIILYGSLARNLTKDRTSEDPSNIDIAVVGEFSPKQKESILDSIRVARQQVTTEIKVAELCKCQGVKCKCSEQMTDYYWVNSTAPIRNGYGEITRLHSGFFERAGVVIQTPETARSNGYSDARRYISSSAKSLYDPEGVWQEIENEALVYFDMPPLVKRKIRHGKPIDYFINKYIDSLNTSDRYQKDTGVIDRVIQTIRWDSKCLGDF